VKSAQVITIEFALNRPFTRLGVILAAVVLCALLCLIIFSQFAIGTLSDARIQPSRDALLLAADRYPSAASLHARFAEAELRQESRDLSLAESHALRAVSLSPYNYKFRLVLAQIQELKGDRLAAEQTLRAAVRLAPNYSDVHYRLANLLLREGKLDESLDEFRKVIQGKPSLLPAAFDTIWRASNEDVEAVAAVAGDSPKAKLALAQFLLKQSRVDRAASVFDHIDRQARLASVQESAAFLNALVAAGHVELARKLWLDLMGSGQDAPLIWNGGFESGIKTGFTQFDWQMTPSSYARLSIDHRTSHEGSRALRIDFVGRDTTRLDDEIKQMVLLQAGKHYGLEFYVKTEGLVTPEGPRVVITKVGSPEWIAASEAIPAGSSDWKRMVMDFTVQSAPQVPQAFYVSIKRKPKYSYDEPTRGTVWFDDFKLVELPTGM
jgi:tetratricopeptide (TPR) repeat protein